MPHLSRTFLALVAVALCAPAAAGAAEPWGTAKTVDRASGGERIGVGAVGLDERGGFLAAWTRGNARRARIVAARGTPRLGFGRPAVLRSSRNTIDSPAVEFDERGTALIAYRFRSGRNLRIGTQRVTRRGTLGAAQILSGPGPSAFFPQFVDPVFERPVLWWMRGGRTDPDVQLSRASVSGRFSATVRYDVEGATADMDLAAAPDGTLYAAIVRRDPADQRHRVYLARQAPGSTQISLTALSDGAGFPREPQIVASRARGVVAAWTESTGTEERLMAAQSTDGRTFTAPEAVAAGGFMSQLKVIATTGNQVIAGWVASLRGPAYAQPSGRLRMMAIGAPGARSAIVTSQTTVAGFALDPDGRGGATTAYIGSAGSVYAAAIGRTGRFGVARQISPRGDRALTASLSAGQRGDAMVMWVTERGRALRVARRPG